MKFQRDLSEPDRNLIRMAPDSHGGYCSIHKSEAKTLSNDGAIWVTSPWTPSYLRYIGLVKDISEINLEKLSILIVDGSPYSRQLEGALLRAIGIREIHQAQDGTEALELLKHTSVDIAITEWNMEPMDGAKFTQTLRRDLSSPNRFMPINMLSGRTDHEFVCKARDAGINETLAKPVFLDQLYKSIVHLIVSPRSFVEKKGFVGPDRRRHDSNDYDGPPKRVVDSADMDKSKLSRADPIAKETANGSDGDVKIFPPSKSLQDKVGTPPPAPNRIMIERAEQLVCELKDDYMLQMCADLEALDKLLGESDGDFLEDEVRALALELVFKIKGEAPTQGFDLVGQAAESLSKILERNAEIAKNFVAIMRSHVEVITAMARGGSDNDEAGRKSVETLESLWWLTSRGHGL